MSAKKKQKKKTPEGLLQEALVPEEEQPYEIPENWVWIKLESVFTLVKERFNPIENNPTNYIGLENLAKDGGIINVASTEGLKSTKTPFKPGDILYGKLRPYLNKHAFVDFEGVASTDILVFRSIGFLNPLLLDQYLNLPHIISYTNNNSKGINLPRVSPQSLLNLAVPLPPLPEQKRIVDRVESLLDKIYEAKQLIVEARETFADRRAAILAKAFRGELTKKWREQNPDIEPADKLLERIKEGKVKQEQGKKRKRNQEELSPIEPPYELPEGWCWSSIDKLTSFVGSGITPRGGKSVYLSEGIPFLRSQNVLKGKMNFEDVAYISEEMHQQMNRTHLVGDETLLNITGASIGRAARFPSSLAPANVNQHVCILRFIKGINPELPQLWLNSPILQEILMNTQAGVTRQGLNYGQVKSFPFPVPPQKEQDQLVKRLRLLLDYEEQALQIEELEKHLDSLTQSILTKAFRGELGTNDPNEESALELLKEIVTGQANDGLGNSAQVKREHS